MSEHRKAIVDAVGEHLANLATESDYFRSMALAKARCLFACLDRPTSPELIAVQTHVGSLDLEDYDSDLLRKLNKLWAKTTGDYDSGCSHGHGVLLTFAYHAAFYAAEVSDDTKQRELKARLAALEREKLSVLRELGTGDE